MAFSHPPFSSMTPTWMGPQGGQGYSPMLVEPVPVPRGPLAGAPPHFAGPGGALGSPSAREPMSPAPPYPFPALLENVQPPPDAPHFDLRGGNRKLGTPPGPPRRACATCGKGLREQKGRPSCCRACATHPPDAEDDVWHDPGCTLCLLQGGEAAEAGYSGDDLVKVVRLCRRASKIHFELILMPTFVVRARINPSTNWFYADKGDWRIWLSRVGAAFLMAVIVFLPYVYDLCFMEDQGKRRPTIWRNATSGQAQAKAYLSKKPGLQATRSEQNEFAGSFAKHEIWLGLWILFKAWCLIGFMALSTLILQGLHNLLRSKHRKVHELWRREDWFLRIKSWMWWPLLMLWYHHVNVKMDRLRYANEGNIFHCFYSPPSVMVCMVYVVVCYELFKIGWEAQSLASAFICAVGMLSLFATVGNMVLGGEDTVVSHTKESVRKWLPSKNVWLKKGSLTVLQKLTKAAKDRVWKISLTHQDLLQLFELNLKVQGDQLKHSDRLPFDGTVDDVGVIHRVVLVDANQEVKLVSGRVVEASSDPASFLEGDDAAMLRDMAMAAGGKVIDNVVGG